jgi:MFS transporter, CP family, cyanate transporter
MQNSAASAVNSGAVPSDQATPTFVERHKKWLIASVLFGMYVSFGMSWMGVVPILQELQVAFQFDKASGSWLVSIVSMAKSIFPILAGILASRWGLTRSMRLGAILIVLGVIVPFLPSFTAWIVMRFLFGVGGAIWVTLMGAVTLQVFEPQQRPMINALNGVAVTVGVVAALQLTLPLTAFMGWQLTLAAYSALSAVFMVLLFALGQLPGQQPAKEGPSLWQTLKAYGGTMKLPVTWIISLSFTGPLALYLVMNYWLPVYYQEVMGLAKPQTMQLMTWMNMGGIVGSVVTGYLLQKLNKTKVFIASAAVLLPVSAGVAMLITNPAVLPFILFVAGVSMFLSVSPLITLLQSQPDMNPGKVGMILGTMFSVTYIVSSLAPDIVGRTYQAQWPLQMVLLSFCITTISPALALLLPEKTP